MSKKNANFGVSGKGYYIALVLCAVAIALTGFLYYRNSEKETSLQQTEVGPVISQQDDQLQEPRLRHWPC